MSVTSAAFLIQIEKHIEKSHFLLSHNDISSFYVLSSEYPSSLHPESTTLLFFQGIFGLAFSFSSHHQNVSLSLSRIASNFLLPYYYILLHNSVNILLTLDKNIDIVQNTCQVLLTGSKNQDITTMMQCTFSTSIIGL